MLYLADVAPGLAGALGVKLGVFLASSVDLNMFIISLNCFCCYSCKLFANANISNFYLITRLKQPEYAKVKLSDILEEVIKEYKLHEMTAPDGWVYIKAIRGMYSIPQLGSLGHDLLEERLNQEGYYQSQIVSGLWKHKTKSIKFILVVDDFGIKYLKKEDLNHLIKSNEKYYKVTVDLEWKEHIKIELDWDYKN